MKDSYNCKIIGTTEQKQELIKRIERDYEINIKNDIINNNTTELNFNPDLYKLIVNVFQFKQKQPKKFTSVVNMYIDMLKHTYGDIITAKKLKTKENRDKTEFKLNYLQIYKDIKLYQKRNRNLSNIDNKKELLKRINQAVKEENENQARKDKAEDKTKDKTKDKPKIKPTQKEEPAPIEDNQANFINDCEFIEDNQANFINECEFIEDNPTNNINECEFIEEPTKPKEKKKKRKIKKRSEDNEPPSLLDIIADDPIKADEPEEVIKPLIEDNETIRQNKERLYRLNFNRCFKDCINKPNPPGL